MARKKRSTRSLLVEDKANERIAARRQPRRLEFLEYLILTLELEALALTTKSGYQPAVQKAIFHHSYYTPSGDKITIDIPIHKHHKPFIHHYIQQRLLRIGIRMSYKAIRDILDGIVTPVYETAELLTGESPKRR